MALECPVCLELYNLTDRTPHVFQCRHTACQRCLKKLRQSADGTVLCPICRETSKRIEVKVNFTVQDLVAEHCQVCLSRKHSTKCQHCQQNLCKTCLDKHAVEYQKSTKQILEKLGTAIIEATKQTLDQTAINKQRKKEGIIIGEIKAEIQTRKVQLDSCGEVLQDKVRKKSAGNKLAHVSWVKDLNSKVDNAKSFLHEAREELESSGHPSEKEVEINTRARDILSNLTETQGTTPVSIECNFIVSDSLPYNVGRIACQAMHGGYTGIKGKWTTGGEGSAPEQFKLRGFVSVVEDRIVVVDYDNHRLKIYGHDLDLLYITGEHGDGKYEFNKPSGVCSIGSEFYVSDHLNHRIKVFNKYGQLSRTFGSQGSRTDQFHNPLGLAADPKGNLLICDSMNHRIKVVRPDGAFVKFIGAGTFKEWPQRVAVTSNGTVLVTDFGGVNVYAFNTRGDFLPLQMTGIPPAPKVTDITDITVDHMDNIIVTDRNNDRLLVLSLKGDFIYSLGTPGCRQGQLNGPWSVAVTESGDLVVYEIKSKRLQVFSMEQ